MNWYQRRKRAKRSKKSSSKNLKDQLLKLGSERPNLQKHIRPVLDRISRGKTSDFSGLSHHTLSQLVEDRVALDNPEITYTGGGIAPNSKVKEAARNFDDEAVRAVSEWVKNNPQKMGAEYRDRDPREVAKEMLSSRNIYELLSSFSGLGAASGDPWADERVEKDFFADPPRGAKFGAPQARELTEHLSNDRGLNGAARNLKRKIQNQGITYND